MSTTTPQRAAKRLNDHHSKTCAGFYDRNAEAGERRCFSARVRAGKLEVSPDFGETWRTVEDLKAAAFYDHNGRPIFL